MTTFFFHRLKRSTIIYDEIFIQRLLLTATSFTLAHIETIMALYINLSYHSVSFVDHPSDPESNLKIFSSYYKNWFETYIINLHTITNSLFFLISLQNDPSSLQGFVKIKFIARLQFFLSRRNYHYLYCPEFQHLDTNAFLGNLSPKVNANALMAFSALRLLIFKYCLEIFILWLELKVFQFSKALLYSVLVSA